MYKISVRVKTAKGRKISSTCWLQRQLNDPYVLKAKKQGYRSRSAYKLIEINDKFNILKKGLIVVDLGCVPGGWSQVVASRVICNNQGAVFGLDMKEMDPIPNVDFTLCNIISDIEILRKKFTDKKIDVVLSDMAPQSCGHKQVDHAHIINLCKISLDFSINFLNNGGVFITKILQGEYEKDLYLSLKQHFKIVKYFKPKASRSNSAEMYMICIDFLKKNS